MRNTIAVGIGMWLLSTAAGLPGVAGESATELPSVAERRARTAIMVHRGSLDLAVENTLAAIEASFLTGADGVEIDIAQTSDGILVLMHDSWVDRVLDSFGNVAELTYDELLAMQYRDPYGLTRVDERVPTLREAFELIGRYNGLIHLDIKVPGVDRQVHDLLATMNLFENVVTVNDYNSDQVRADSRIKVLPSQGSLIHGNNDYDAEAVHEHLKRRPQGTLLVDDARCAAALLGRQHPKDIDDLVIAELSAEQTRPLDVSDGESDTARLVKLLEQINPVQQFEADKGRSHQLAAVIRDRAALAKALGRTGDANDQVCDKLESMINRRSLHVDGAWQGLDGSEAVRALAAIRPDAQTVKLLSQVAQQMDPRLTEVEKREELPWWLRQSGAWWDFRIKTESIAALGKIGSSQAREALWRMLEQSPDEAEPKWRELHWDAARALTCGTWLLSADELKQLLVHKTNGVRRAGYVYLARYREREEYQMLLPSYLPWWTEKK